MTEAWGKQRTVVIAMDGSHFAAYAFEWYLRHVHKSKDHVIIVYSQELNFHLYGHKPEPTTMMSQYQDMSAKSKELLESLEQRLKDAKISGKVRCERGDPGHTVVKVAEEENAELIVTGCRGLGTVRRTLMGSVSDYIIHHSHVPVIVCRHSSHDFHQHGHKHHH